MKKVRKVCLILLIAILTQTAVFGVAQPVQVQAAVKKGLVRKGKKVYFYKKNTPLKNKWKTVKDGDRKYRFYFGKNGAAYRAGTLFQNAYNVKLFSIGKKKYGFDSNSHLVEKGIYVDGSSRLFVFGKKGLYNAKATKTLRSAMKTYHETGKVSTDIYDKVVRLLGEPLTVTRTVSCNPWNDKDSFTDVVMKYTYFEVQLVQNDRTKEYALDNYFSR